MADVIIMTGNKQMVMKSEMKLGRVGDKVSANIEGVEYSYEIVRG